MKEEREIEEGDEKYILIKKQKIEWKQQKERKNLQKLCLQWRCQLESHKTYPVCNNTEHCYCCVAAYTGHGKLNAISKLQVGLLNTPNNQHEHVHAAIISQGYLRPHCVNRRQKNFYSIYDLIGINTDEAANRHTSCVKTIFSSGFMRCPRVMCKLCNLLRCSFRLVRWSDLSKETSVFSLHTHLKLIGQRAYSG